MPGDMANASTFEFQVQHKIVTSSTLKAVKQADPKVGRALIKAAQALQSQGVRAIVGGCGFFGYFQQLVTLVEDHIKNNPDVAAIVAEYTEFPTFAWAVQHEVNVPIYDCTTLTRWVYSGVVRHPFPGLI